MKRATTKKNGRRLTTLLLVLILLVGLGLIAYPVFSEYWNSFHQSRAIMTYAAKVADLNAEEYERIWNAALDYNRRLTENGMVWPATEEELSDYERQLNVDGTGNMGFITVPKADISLPLYHGTDEAVLQTSVGHILGTSLPAGSLHDEDDFSQVAYGTHSVLSGHRGLPTARLFSDLDMMQVGDLFYLTILDQTLTYEIDKITVIEPEDLTEIQIEPGKDLCTLVTCTPYGINTHRLLVRGTRIENEKPKLNVRITADALKIEPVYVAPFIAVPVLFLLVVWVLIITSGRKRPDRA